MPIYEYRCPKCNKTVELVQSIMQRKSGVIPLCLEENCSIEMEPVISKSSFALKGSGWARDGYSKKGQ